MKLSVQVLNQEGENQRETYHGVLNQKETNQRETDQRKQEAKDGKGFEGVEGELKAIDYHRKPKLDE